jgi:small subunit ribosomal protein S16
MLKIRLQRTGRKHEPTFKLVLTDSKNSTKSGKFLEVLGSHDFRGSKKPVVKADRVRDLMKNGVKLTDTVHNLFVAEKIIEGKKINVLPKKTVAKKEEVPVAEAPKEEAPKVEEKPAE